MPLLSMIGELRKAQAGRYALPAFDTFESAGTVGLFEAFEEKRAPAIVAIAGGVLERPGTAALAAYVRRMAEETSLPVALMVDHARSFEICIMGLRFGFSDVMYDGSTLPLEENIANTRLVVRAAHAVGVCVEAEVGHVGSGSSYRSYGALRKGLTDPAIAEQFVAETGVDTLAVAIGNAHGVYDGEPCLDLDLLAEIRRRLDVPLVLHGGSGLSEDQFRSAVAAGISKINIFTDLAMNAHNRMAEAVAADQANYFPVAAAERQAFKDRAMYFLDLFGASGKADANGNGKEMAGARRPLAEDNL